MAFTTKGFLHFRGEIKPVSKDLRSQEIVLRQPSFDQWTGEEGKSNYVQLETIRENVINDLLGMNENDKVEVEFYPKGVEYEKKDGSGKGYFTKLQLLSIKRLEDKRRQASSTQTAPQESGDLETEDEIGDDLPF